MKNIKKTDSTINFFLTYNQEVLIKLSNNSKIKSSDTLKKKLYPKKKKQEIAMLKLSKNLKIKMFF